MQKPAEESDRHKAGARYLLLRSTRILMWWCIAEYMIHVMYMHAIQSNETYLEILPPWALGECTCSYLSAGTSPGFFSPGANRRTCAKGREDEKIIDKCILK